MYQPNETASIETVDQFRQYVRDELRAVAREFNESIALELRESFAPPAKPRNGMIVFASGDPIPGTVPPVPGWDPDPVAPGDGRGLWVFDGVWKRVTTVPA